MTNEEKHELEIDQSLDEHAVRGVSENAYDMRRRLFALIAIRSKLMELSTNNIQVLEPGQSGAHAMKTTLDFILRNENVELQLEIRYPDNDKLSLNIEDFQRYRKIFMENAKTEEILITWDNQKLEALPLNLAQIENYLAKGEQLIDIDKTSLAPLIEAIECTFEKHRPDWIRETPIELGEVSRLDLHELFSEALRENIKRMKATAETRRYEDRKKALESISEYDIKQLEDIFDKNRISELTAEDIYKLMQKFIPEQ